MSSKEKAGQALSNTRQYTYIGALREHEKNCDLKLGALLRSFRNQNGITQIELAAAAGISFQQIQKYEKGLDRISFSRLLTLLDFLGVDFTDFCRGMEWSPIQFQ